MSPPSQGVPPPPRIWPEAASLHVSEKAADGRCAGYLDGLTRHHGPQRFFQIAPGWLRHGFSEIDITIIDTPVIEQLAAGRKDSGFGRNPRLRQPHQIMPGVAQRSERVAVLSHVLMNYAGGTRGIGIHKVKDSARRKLSMKADQLRG